MVMIFSDSSENDTVIADFIFRASEVDWLIFL